MIEDRVPYHICQCFGGLLLHPLNAPKFGAFLVGYELGAVSHIEIIAHHSSTPACSKVQLPEITEVAIELGSVKV
jgi:hypothetical protein